MQHVNVEWDAKTEAVIDKIRKLLALANNNPNEREAEAASAKAHELLEAYNLDVAIVSKQSNKFAARDQRIFQGGLYKWQRDLWDMTARLNFCKYYFKRGLEAGSQYEHELIGSKANVIATQIMANYLQQAIERLTRQWCETNYPNKSIFFKPAIAYREGMAARIVTRMWNLREQHLREEKERIKREREANAAQGINTENALVLQDVISTEEDLNLDFIYKLTPGTSAQRRHESNLRQQAAEKAAEEQLAKQRAWDAANPEEAAKRRAKEQKQWDEYMAKNRAKPRAPTAEELRRMMPSFREGYDKGDEVSLNKQVDKDSKRRLE